MNAWNDRGRFLTNFSQLEIVGVSKCFSKNMTAPDLKTDKQHDFDMYIYPPSLSGVPKFNMVTANTFINFQTSSATEVFKFR